MGNAQEKRKSRERAKRLGVTRILVPAGPTSKHIAYLRKRGMSMGAIARESGITQSAIFKIASDPGRCVHPETASAILAVVPVPNVKDVQRHIKNLRRVGWELRDIADASGVSLDHLRKIERGFNWRGKFQSVHQRTLSGILSIELPPKAADDIDEVQVMRLMDPHRDKPADATAAEIKRAVDILSTRHKVDRRTAAAWIHQERWRMKAA